MNPGINKLQPYPFAHLRALLADVKQSEHATNQSAIALSIGEPQHPPPPFAAAIIAANFARLGNYPLTRGSDELRSSICQWLSQRFDLPISSLDPQQHVLPVSGTREALFSIAQCLLDPADNPVVMMPNPFYQIYEGAALLGGGEPCFLNCTADNNFLPDLEAIPDAIWQRCKLFYSCSPGNPSGRVMDLAYLQRLIELAQRHNFVLVADECYSEIYTAEQPPGLLQACDAMGLADYRNCLVMHSLSKRSNLPGLRSGFVAGDAKIIALYLQYRTYQGCAMPGTTQLASQAAWEDEQHVQDNRDAYAEKFASVLDILAGSIAVSAPDAGFYLWPETPLDELTFTQRLYAEENVTALPGSYLSRTANGINPGSNRIRLALVAPLADCAEAARRIARCVANC